MIIEIYHQFNDDNEFKMDENIINYMNNIENTNLSEKDKEFEKYLKLFKEKFGRNAYIAEPSGTKQQTIGAIKICLKENKDILDELLYPNTDKYIY